jgi:sRNA-binding regulator protein Hfq
MAMFSGDDVSCRFKAIQESLLIFMHNGIKLKGALTFQTGGAED